MENIFKITLKRYIFHATIILTGLHCIKFITLKKIEKLIERVLNGHSMRSNYKVLILLSIL